jgi:WhiB family transcriptional regulator, redox-sensing transcriptional regulator
MATVTTETWQQLANCTGIEPDLFFPALGGDPACAKAVCRGCVVRRQCLQDAIDRDEWSGVWGGYTAVERRRLVRRRTLPVTAMR